MRNPKSEGWTIVRNYEDFVNFISDNGVPDEISFDHDLGSDIKSGYDCAKWLCEYCYGGTLPLPKWNVHSANPVGVDNINQLLKTYEERHNLI